MNLLHTFIFGIVEGVTEFLPISSTGHLILTAHALNLKQTEFLKSFEIAIQLGAILAVVLLYWKTLVKGLSIWKRILIAFLPTACIGMILYKIIKKFLLGNHAVVLWSLFIGGIVLIVFELFYREKEDACESIDSISYKQSFCIGLFQSVAVIPGVSRAAATIIGGLSLGLKRKIIVEFSFLLAIPTMLAATALDLARSANTFNTHQVFSLCIGFLVSFAIAAVAIKFLLRFIKRHNFIVFGIYRICIAILFWFVLK
ncbi:MAG: undecaprenyl-diphosphate phosphatase [Candidatus Omnitrophica bacterium]|nr:undecaprenyl-diphosphate phosphatase [Candidatus Omnitrophota bacterium]